MNIFVRCTSHNSSNRDYILILRRIADFINHGHHHLVTHAFSDRGLAKFFLDLIHTPIYSGAKFTFIKHADVLVFLPGGFGTLSSLNYAIEAKRELKHNLPIVIVNVDGFYDAQLEMFKRIYSENFYSEKNAEKHNLYKVVKDGDELLQYLSDLQLKMDEVQINS